jgi:hypothetical protein
VKFARGGDPRRVGIAVGVLGGGYIALLFMPTGPVVFRVVLVLSFAVAACIVGAAMPLRPWREAEERKRRAMWAMAAKTVTIWGAATVVRLMVG